MKLFSLDWFKSEKQKELDSLKVEEQKLKNKLLEQDIDMFSTPHKGADYDIDVTLYSKPYLNIKFVNNVITVVLNDGNIVSKVNATISDFNQIRSCTTEDELFTKISVPEVVKERKEYEKKVNEFKDLINGIERLKRNPDFEVKDDAVYMQGINRTMPKLLVERFSSLSPDSDEYDSLKKFWLKCCLNPNAQSAEDLYAFLQHHQFKIDRHGNFYAYRRVVSKSIEDKELIEFINNTYNKIKAVWKKKPIHYEVVEQSGSFKIEKTKASAAEHSGTWIGNLEDLYLELPNMKGNSYTSAHTGQEDYRVGNVISMPRNNGDDDNRVSCSKGFHAASKEYDYSGFGNTPILVIINPMDVLAVPHGEVGKLRTCRWFFAMTLSEDEQYILDDDDFDVIDLGDLFEEKCLEDIHTYVQNSFAEEVQRHTFSLSNITSNEVNNIVVTLEDMKQALESRVVDYK